MYARLSAQDTLNTSVSGSNFLDRQHLIVGNGISCSEDTN